ACDSLVSPIMGRKCVRFAGQSNEGKKCLANPGRFTVRQGDLTGRIGGEEFVAICFETDGDGVMHLAERLRAGVESEAIKVAGSNDLLRCTVTIGVSPHFHGADGLEDALRQADSALYRGKAAGRNRIEVAEITGGTSAENIRLAMASS